MSNIHTIFAKKFLKAFTTRTYYWDKKIIHIKIYLLKNFLIKLTILLTIVFVTQKTRVQTNLIVLDKLFSKEILAVVDFNIKIMKNIKIISIIILVANNFKNKKTDGQNPMIATIIWKHSIDVA